MPNPISCVLTNVQYGDSRFGRQNDPPPRLKNWRCELTALSKVYNLYFVANNDTIQIYQPSFPDQTLLDDPLVLRPPTTAPGLRGYLDSVTPHSINRIVVEFLGQEEVVIVACDDGDVVGYRVHEIQHAVERHNRSRNNGKREEEETPIRSFLHRNVGMSAWGLAVHRQARLIAISSNTYKVTVIAYALSGSTNVDPETTNPSPDEDSDSSSSSFDESPDDEDEKDFPYPRRRDHILTCSAAGNIPSVSFDNSDSDPSGRWMFSSSIDGKSLLWDLHQSKLPLLPVQHISLGYCVGNRHVTPRHGVICACPDRDMLPHAVWSTTFMDPQSFRRYHHLREAFGTKDVRVELEPPVWNVTKSKRYLRFTDLSPTSSDEEGEIIEEVLSMNHEEEEAEDVSNQNATESDSLFVPETDPTISESSITSSETSEDGDVHEDDDNTSEPGEGDWPYQTQMLPEGVFKEFYCEAVGEVDISISDRPNFPCLIVTKGDIYMLPSPFNLPPSINNPIIALPNPLYMYEYQQHNHDRLSFSVQIPELGILIIASPGGLAAVFSLTHFVSKTDHAYGFRMDYLLPFPRQLEGLNIGGNPGIRLVGVAVGPVQGMLDGDAERINSTGSDGSRGLDARRWRLMLMYNDHTVLSYELGKNREDAEEAPGLAELVV